MDDQNPGTIADTAKEVAKVLEGEHVEESTAEREETGRAGDGAHRDTAEDSSKAPEDPRADEEARRGDEPVANLE